MSLSLRLTLALSTVALLIFGAVGFWQVRAEESDLRRAAKRDLRLLGRSLQVAFENALRDRQDEDLQETLSALERIDREVDVFVYDAQGVQLAASVGAQEQPRWRRTPPRTPELSFRLGASSPTIEMLLPLRVTHEGDAMLVVVRPLDEMQEDLNATTLRVVLSMLGFVALVALLTMALARFWVGSPLAQMNAHMRRVRAGDLSPSPIPRAAGEVADSLREFETLVRDLAEARARLDAETEARRRLEDGLRHIDKLTTVGQLAAGLAHEIGSPLQILEGRLSMLESKADDPRETRRLAQILVEQSRRITRIVSRLTGLARRSVQRSLIQVGPSVRTVVELMEGEAKRRGIALSLDEEASLPAVEGEADAIQQVMLNLVRNALAATPPGGRVEVRIARAEQTDPGGLREIVQIKVTDSGCGMDEITRAQIFEPFFTTRSAEGGSGLGLAVVKGIVDEHGGRIRLHSEVGVGTTFEVDFAAMRSSNQG